MSDLVIDALTAAGVAGQTTVRVELTDNRSNPVPGYVIGESDVIVAPVVATTDEDGHVVIDLIPNADINPPNTIYTVTVGDKNFTIQKLAASQTLFEALIQDPPPLDPIPTSDFLQVDLNLSDVADPALSRQSLGLGDSAVLDVGTVAGTVAAGDDPRFTTGIHSDLTGRDVADSHPATAISVTPFGTIASTNVQAALEEVLAESNPPASLVTFSPAGDIVATNVQAAIVEVDAELHAHEADTVDAHDATAISFAPAGGIAATDVQAAIVEAKTDAATDATAYTDLHIADPTDAHLASAIGYTPTGVLDALTVQAGLDEIADTIGSAAIPSGFPDLTATTISVVDSGANLTFTIAPTGANFDIWLFGDKVTKTTETVTMTDATAVYYIYYTAAGTLTATSYVTQPTGFIWGTQVPVAIVYRGTTNNDLSLHDNRHGLTMDWSTRSYLHTTRGTQLGTGLVLSNYVLSPSSPVGSDNLWSMTTGTLYNEDLTYTVPATAVGGPYTTLYRLGTTEFSTSTSFATSIPFALSGTDLAYNLNTAGTWSLSAVPSGSFVNYFIFVTGSQTTGYKTFAYPDSTYYSTQALAEAAAIVSPFAAGGFAYSEFFMRYRVTYQRSNAYTNTGRCRTVAVTAIAASQTLITGATPTDHSLLTGRSTVNSHPASAVTNVPAGNVAATTVQAAINELDTEKAALTGATFTGALAATATITSAASNTALMTVNGTLNGSGNASQGLTFQPTLAPSTSILASYGGLFVPSYSPPTSVTITESYGLFLRPDTGSAGGSITTQYGLQTASPLYGATKPANGYGIDVRNQGSAGMTIAVGLNVRAQSGSSNNISCLIEESSLRTLHVASSTNPTTATGGILFGSSSDTNLYRSAADTLKTDDSFHVGAREGIGTAPTASARIALASGTTAADGILFGTDAVLYRSAADTLKTDDSLHVATTFAVGSAPSSTRLLLASGLVPGGGTAQYGFVTVPTINSAATVAAGGYAGLDLQAAVFTVGQAHGLYVASPSLGAGSAITVLYGLEVSTQGSGSTSYTAAFGLGGTQTVWVNNTSNSTTAAGGIAFGSSRDTNLYRSAAGLLATDNSFSLATVGGGFKIKEGTNATSGVATMVAGTVVVPTTKVTASSRIQLAIQSLGTVVLPQAIGVTARTAGTSFTITSAGATDTSVVAWVIIEPA